MKAPKSNKSSQASQSIFALTVREQEVLALVAAGLSYKQIADTLNISSNTVNNHLANIRRKLGVHSAIEAINRAHLWLHIKAVDPFSSPTVGLQ